MSFYRHLRKWRFDLLPLPNVHFSHNDYNVNNSDTLIVELGHSADAAFKKEFFTSHTRDLGLEGKEYQKFYLTIQLLKRMIRMKEIEIKIQL
jgi:hypothetical protein